MRLLGNKMYRLLSYLLVLAIFVVTAPAFAQTPVLKLSDNTDSTESISLLPHLSYLEDKEAALDATAAVLAHEEGGFKAITGNSVDFGYTGHRYWLHSKIHNAGTSEQNLIYDLGHVRMAEFGVYILRDGSLEVLAEVSGYDTFQERTIKHRLLLANVKLLANEKIDLFVKFRSYGSTNVTPKLSQSWAFMANDSMVTMLHSLLIGALLLLALYNLIMSALLKSLPHLLYVFFVLSGLLHVAQQTGLAFVYIWPNQGFINANAANILGLLTVIFVMLFFRNFFNMKETDKLMDNIAKGLIGFAIMLIIVSLLYPIAYIGKIGFSMMTIVALVNFVASIRAFKRGFKPARFAALGWAGVLFGSVYVALSINGLIPIAVEVNVVFELTMLFESLLFLASLVDYVTEMRIARDNTQKRLIHSLEEGMLSNQEAAAKGRALSVISHDIRQPIHALKLYIQGLRNTKSWSKAVLGLEQMSHTITSLERLLSSVMDSSEPENSGELIINEHFSANRLISSTQLIFAAKAEQKGLLLKTVPSSLQLYTDLGVMMRIVNNIVSNAVKYTDAGKVLIGFRRRHDKSGTKAVLQVFDTGQGIPDEQLVNIFDSYSRLDVKAENKDSYGLGLSIVKKLTDKIGAKVSIKSKLGVGTLFEVEMPISPARQDNAHSKSLEGVKAVIIDDNPITLDELEQQLKGFGVELVKGRSWAECLRQVPDNWQPDIVISDLHLSNDTTGLHAASMIYDHFGKQLPTLIISFDRLAKTRQQVASFKHAEMQYKPLEADILLDKIKLMLKL